MILNDRTAETRACGAERESHKPRGYLLSARSAGLSSEQTGITSGAINSQSYSAADHVGLGQVTSGWGEVGRVRWNDQQSKPPHIGQKCAMAALP